MSALLAAIKAQEHAAHLAPLRADAHSELGRLRTALAAQLLGSAADAHVQAAMLTPQVPMRANSAALLHTLLHRRDEARHSFKGALLASQAHLGSGRAAFASAWSRAASELRTQGYTLLDGAAGAETATTLGSELLRLLPLMHKGRVGTGVARDTIRTDLLWRHRRGESSVLDPSLRHVKALHALFDSVVCQSKAPLKAAQVSS